MTKFKVEKTVYTSPDGKDTIYLTDRGVYVWDVEIDAGIGEEVYIAHISDIHLNYCNYLDFQENDPVLMSTYEHRMWLRNAASAPALRNCIEMAGDPDLFVFNGDTLDYQSRGAMELMDREIWERLPGCIATVGGHEIARQMQGTVAENTTRAERLGVLESYWRHDIYYTMKIINNKVMVIGFLNDYGLQTAEQTAKLRADLDTARKQGYPVLLFAHEPIVTNNPEYRDFGVKDMLFPGDTTGYPKNYYDCGGKRGIAGSSAGDEASREFYDVVYNSADVIKAFFAGHEHDDFKLDIIAKTPDGEQRIIPQFVHTTSAIAQGHFMRIIIK